MAREHETERAKRHRLWLKFVAANVRVLERGKKIPLGPSPAPTHALAKGAAPGHPLRVLICSPHPDDEALVGALPLRLRREAGAIVSNCAITLGSEKAQRGRRLRELKSSCGLLGFRLVVMSPPGGFDHVLLATRRERPAEWSKMVRALSRTLAKESPDVIFAPHAADGHATHIATHHLVVDATRLYLKRLGGKSLIVIETEYWHQLSSPNLMVGISPQDEATLVMATAEHDGEVRRNPYHLRHPARMIDNVRRGAEMVGRAGGPAPDFPFAELYRLVLISPKRWTRPRATGLVIAPGEKIDWTNVVEHFKARS